MLTHNLKLCALLRISLRLWARGGSYIRCASGTNITRSHNYILASDFLLWKEAQQILGRRRTVECVTPHFRISVRRTPAFDRAILCRLHHMRLRMGRNLYTGNSSPAEHSSSASLFYRKRHGILTLTDNGKSSIIFRSDGIPTLSSVDAR